MRVIAALLIVHGVSASSLRLSVLDALRNVEERTPKCKSGGTSQACADCGCTVCPCCISGGDLCPPIDSATCASLSMAVSNGGTDPLSCAQSYMPSPQACQDRDVDGDGGVSRDECQAVTGSGGNMCMWYSYTDATNQYGGSCLLNTCANLNDGSCTLQQTGGRCVWYGNPNNLRTIDGVKEAPNPYQDTSGCYTSPCNNPTPNTARGCEAENDINPYKCQWCYVKTETQGMQMGCQNAYPESIARPSTIAAFPEQGKAPCGNYYCNFMEFKATHVSGMSVQQTKRTNSAKSTYPTVDGTDNTYTWATAYGTGESDDLCSCPPGDGTAATPSCTGPIPTLGAI